MFEWWNGQPPIVSKDLDGKAEDTVDISKQTLPSATAWNDPEASGIIPVASSQQTTAEERRVQQGGAQNAPSRPKRTYNVGEIAELLSISRSAAYVLVREGHFKTVRIGTAIRISKASFDKWLDAQD